jgi:hypothetical protein
LISCLAGCVAYAPYVVLESLADFMERPRQVANIGLLILVFCPVVLIFGAVWWKITKPKLYFFESLTVSALFTIVIMAGVHQIGVTERWRETPEGRLQTETAKGADAWDKVILRSEITQLKPPLDPYTAAALAKRVHDPDVDGATLHYVVTTLPKQVDCDVIQNSNILQSDLVAIWKEHSCLEEYFIANPHTPLDLVKSIFDSNQGAETDATVLTTHDRAAIRLAKESCNPKLLYSLFNAKSDFPLNTSAGIQMRTQMVSNICTPLVVRAQMSKMPDLKQPTDYERYYGNLARGNQQAGEAQYWVPSR